MRYEARVHERHAGAKGCPERLREHVSHICTGAGLSFALGAETTTSVWIHPGLLPRLAPRAPIDDGAHHQLLEQIHLLPAGLGSGLWHSQNTSAAASSCDAIDATWTRMRWCLFGHFALLGLPDVVARSHDSSWQGSSQIRRWYF